MSSAPLATKARRAELLAARRSWAPTTASSEAIVTVARGEGEQSVHEYLMALDKDGVRVLARASCGHLVSGHRGHCKSGLPTHDVDLADLPGFIDPALMIDVPFTLRQYACPGCDTLMASEVAATSEAPLEEVRFA